MSVGCVLLYETTTATATPLNKGINEQNNSCARALQFFVHFFVVLCKIACENSRPSSLPAEWRFARRTTSISRNATRPGAKKDGCFRRLSAKRRREMTKSASSGERGPRRPNFYFLFSSSLLCSGFSFVIVLTVINKVSDFRVS